MSYARRFPLTAYFFLACLIGWYPFAATFLTGGSGAENFPLGPGIAAFVVLACLGREELRAWGRRLRDWRAPVRWYAVALLVPIAVQLLIVLVNHGLGAPLPTSEQLADWPQVPVTFVAMLILVGIGEEIGWTAFAAPRLLERHGFLTAFVLAASIRILWHLPMMLSGDLSWVLGIVGNTGFTMVTLLVLTQSGGRWSLVAVWHASLNAVGGPFFFTMVTGADKARLGLLLSGSYVVLGTVWYIAVSRRRPSADPRTDELAVARARGVS
jgi:membrane protease YdiL (CAAX protease family)